MPDNEGRLAQRPRGGRRLILAACVVMALTATGIALLTGSIAHSQRKNLIVEPAKIEVTARPLPGFQASDPQRRHFGPLLFRGGLVLTSTHVDFGGISGLRLEAGGDRFLAVTDRGNWLGGSIKYDGEAPSKITDAEIAPILAANGRPIASRRRWYDSESLTIADGTAYVGIEGVNQILRFDYAKHGLLARGHPIPVPNAFKSMPRNQGIEALAIPGKGMPHEGKLIVLTERALDERGNIRGFLLADRAHETFTVRRTDEFDITDAATTPSGNLLILERSFSLLRGVRLRIRQIPLKAITPGAVLDGKVLLYADHGYQIDNMEGLSVHEDRSGNVVLTLISDDNFLMLQRTLMLQFTLTEP